MALLPFALFLATIPSALLAIDSIDTNNNESDKIRDLPGLTFTPNFKHYSGYLRVSDEHQLFYWLVTSQHNSSSDPLILWLNGGPGCSSLMGLLSEHGPYLLEGNELVENLNAWNRHASVVYIETPAGVGFSLAGDSRRWNDDETRDENYEAIKQFFARFPEYRFRELFLTGESYAGHYLPLLGQKIVTNQENYSINLKGMAIGNGWLNATLFSRTLPQYLYAHGMIDELDWEKAIAKCPGNLDDCDRNDYLDLTVRGLPQSQEYQYDYYKDCENRGDTEARYLLAKMALDKEIIANHSLGHIPIECEKEAILENYLNRKEVLKALHVSNKAFKWQLCNEKIRDFYQSDYDDGLEEQVKAVLAAGVRVLLYHGDTDTVCNFMMGSKFATHLGQELKVPATAWLYNSEAGGFKTIYEGGLTFITVRGAGHMVPQKKGAQILYAIEAFLKDEEF